MQYGDQRSRLTDLTVEASPERYDLCGVHADRTRPPRGWTLDDDRSDDPVLPSATATGPRSVDDTVALLAAALHEEPAEPVAASPVAEVPASQPEAQHVEPVAPSVAEPVVEHEPAPTSPAPAPASPAAVGGVAAAVGRRVPAAVRGDD